MVCPQTFDVVEQYLHSLSYKGLIGLSCDDTKLHAEYRTYWDATKQVHMLVGGTEPLAVANVEELQRALNDPERKKATKVCTLYPISNIVHTY